MRVVAVAAREKFNLLAAVDELVDSRDVGGRAALVALSLIRHADDRGESFPSVRTIAEEFGISRCTVMRGIGDLERLGWLHVDRSRRLNRYRYIGPIGSNIRLVAPGDESHGETSIGLPVNSQVAPVDTKVPTKEPRKVPKEDDDGVILEFPLKNGGTWPLTAALLAELVEVHPEINAEAECRYALGWCQSNPAKRKTAGGMPAFLSNWLTRESREAADRPSSARRRPGAGRDRVGTIAMNREVLWEEPA